MNYSTLFKGSLSLPGSVLMALLVLLGSCGSDSGSVTALSQGSSAPTTVQSGQNGVFSLAEPVSEVTAGTARVTVTSSEALPETILVAGVPFYALPSVLPGVADTRSYVAGFEESLTTLDTVTEVEIDGVSQATVEMSILYTEPEATTLIFFGDPTSVTFDDFVIIRAVADLPVALRTPDNIATRANELFATRPTPYTAADFDPIPDSANTDFASGGTVPGPDLVDALVVYSASFLPPGQRTAAQITAVANSLAPGIPLAAEDIVAIPGAELPGGILVSPAVEERAAGTIQISVLGESFSASTLVVNGSAVFLNFGTIFEGFTTYVSDFSSTQLFLTFDRITSEDPAFADVCVIVHEVGQDPSRAINQLARSADCPEPEVRIAQFNASLNRSNQGDITTELSTPGSAQPQVIAEIIQRVDPDILLINEFDFDSSGDAYDFFRDNYLEVSQNGATPVDYPFVYAAPSNTGIPSGFDLNNDDSVGGPNDAFGFGFFPGQFGMVIFSKFPIEEANVRTFQTFLWKDMPNALLPDDPETPEAADWYSAEELDVFRLSSKSHWDVPITVGDRVIHILASHPTPPVFDPPDVDFNGRRNNDEIRFWADYVTPGEGDYIYDDNGSSGGLMAGASFVIMGDQNSDPNDGDSFPGAIDQLLNNSNINTSVTPSSSGGTDAAARQGGINASHISDPAFDTADFNDNPAPGNLRADYVLPSIDLNIQQARVFWPAEGEPFFDLVGNFPFPGSDHRLVWIQVN